MTIKTQDFFGASPNTVLNKPFFHAQDQKAYNVDGGTSIADAWTKRTLNTVLVNQIPGASLVSDSVMLPAGTYYVEGVEVQRDTSTGGCGFIAAVFKDGLKVLQGATLFGFNVGAGCIGVNVSGVITLSTSGLIDLRYYSGVALTDGGLGISNNIGSITDSSIPSIYADLKIWKLDADRIYNARVFQPINQPVTDAYVSGNIFGGELVYNNTTSFNVRSFSCMADDLSTPLFSHTTTLVTLATPVLNTIYHAWAVKYNNGTFGVKTDTDINGANLGATVVAKRWLGFVRTNASNQIMNFIMSGDNYSFIKASETVFVTGLAVTTFTQSISPISSIVPVTRITDIYVGIVTSSVNNNVLFISGDGVNTLTYTGGNGSSGDTFPWGTSDGSIVLRSIPYSSSLLMRVNIGNVSVGVAQVALRR